MSRSYTIRKMNGVEHARPCMDYPYGYIRDEDEWCEYPLKDILRSIPVEGEQADAGDFPKNIQEHFWIRPGQNEGDSWLSCGVLSNGNYFFYTGGCDYTGFGCQGGMNLWVSSEWQNIVDHAMSQSEYELYEDQTKVPPATAAGEEPWPTLTREQFWAIVRANIRCDDCGKKGAENEHPYCESRVICGECLAANYGPYEGHDEDRGSRWEEEVAAEEE